MCNSHYESVRLGRGGRISNPQGTVQQRWEAMVQRTPTCWLWTGDTADYGYGRMTVDAKVELAHRVAWELFCGSIPPGRKVLHHCDRPPCVRPDHLFLGGQLDNITDAVVKGRHKHS